MNGIYSNKCGPWEWSRERKVPNGAVEVVGRCKVRWMAWHGRAYLGHLYSIFCPRDRLYFVSAVFETIAGQNAQPNICCRVVILFSILSEV